MRIDRLIGIIMTLLEKERIGATELAEMFEVSPRTIYRDVDSINMAGIPIYSVPGVGGGFEIMKEYKVDKKIFSTTDLSAILMGLSNLSSVIRGEELVNAMAKVKSFIPAEKAREIELKASQIFVDLNPWIGNKNIQENLENIKISLLQNQLITFQYIDRYGKKTARTAEPYQLVLKNSQWYFHGYCLERSDFRLFKISRISGLQIKGEIFLPREFQKPQMDFADIMETMQITIKLRIHKSIMDRVLDFCAYENFSPDGNEHYLVRFPFVENTYYYDVLLGFGAKCECLGPLHVREEMKRRIQEIGALYQK